MDKDKEVMDLQQVTRFFNTTHYIIKDGILQIRHYRTNLYHYLVSQDKNGWVDSGVTSIKADFF